MDPALKGHAPDAAEAHLVSPSSRSPDFKIAFVLVYLAAMAYYLYRGVFEVGFVKATGEPFADFLHYLAFHVDVLLCALSLFDARQACAVKAQLQEIGIYGLRFVLLMIPVFLVSSALRILLKWFFPPNWLNGYQKITQGLGVVFYQLVVFFVSLSIVIFGLEILYVSGVMLVQKLT